MYRLTLIASLLISFFVSLKTHLKVKAVVCTLNGSRLFSSFRGKQRGLGLGLFAPLSKKITALGSLLSGGAIIAIFILATATFSNGATPTGSIISNTATITHSATITSLSNTVSTTVGGVRTASTIEFFAYGAGVPGATNIYVPTTGYSTDGSTTSISNLPSPEELDGTVIGVDGLVPLIPQSAFHGGEAIFLRLTDLDQNTNPLTREVIFLTLTVSATGDTELLVLTETGIDTGVFTGYIQSASGVSSDNNGILEVAVNSEIIATYTDIVDGTDSVSGAILVDPFGLIIDTQTGLSVDGITVTLIDLGTGLPATVYGDDGVSLYPSTVISGGSVTDASGTNYIFPPGGYRFPLIAPGNYRLDIIAPANYQVPSVVPTIQIQALPGAPFQIVLGSRGEDFVVNPGPALHIDIPIDPLTTSFVVTKTSSAKVVSIGDIVSYKVTVTNATVGIIPDIIITDTLPYGFRYAENSTSFNGILGTEPTITPDGRTLTFTIASMNPGEVVIITYGAVVGVDVQNGEAVNTVTAGSGIFDSNLATSTVNVEEVFFKSKNIITGSVLADNCGSELNGEAGVGIRVILEDGTYVLTDSNGMYHFEGIESRTHVVRIDESSIPDGFELDRCNLNSRFAGVDNSQFTDLMEGTLWRADFHLKPLPRIKGLITSELKHRIIADTIKYEIPFNIATVGVKNTTLTVILPKDTIYNKGSATLGGEPIEDPQTLGTTLIFRVGDFYDGFSDKIKFTARGKVTGSEEEFITTALFTFDTPTEERSRGELMTTTFHRTPATFSDFSKDIVLRPKFSVLGATLSTKDLTALDKIIKGLEGINVLGILTGGHTDSVPIRESNREIYKDNYALSHARAKAVGNYITTGLGLPPESLIINGFGADFPVASNKTKKGKAKNRRVELEILTEEVTGYNYLKLTKKDSGKVKTPTIGDREKRRYKTTNKEPKTLIDIYKELPTEAYDYYQSFKVDDIDLSPKDRLSWLWPAGDYHPPIPTTNIAVTHDYLSKATLYINGDLASPLLLDGVSKSLDKTTSITRWRGAPLEDGDNTLEVREVDGAGNILSTIKRTVHYSTEPVKVEYLKDQSLLSADGLASPVITIRLTDKDGHPARRGTKGEFHIEPPYTSFDEAKDINDSPMTGVKNKTALYTVGSDGRAHIKIKETTRSGELTANIILNNGEHAIKPWLRPELRDWILIGVAEGTVGYQTLDGNTEFSDNNDLDEDLYIDGRLAFYAKGRIKGEWLLTISYDSEKNASGDKSRLGNTIDPNKYYTIYDDSTVQAYDGESSRSLYVKLEKENFYALFGNYNTKMTVTELSRYNRSFNGIKTEYKGDHFEVVAFATETSQGFIKDEIRGDGTSGLYHLSRQDILMNTEKVSIEVRDRFNSERVISKRNLTRFSDYSIDYENGTIFFKEPVHSRDFNLNPIYIVIDYESNDQSDKSMNYGARVGVNLLNDKALNIGLSLVHEETIGSEGNLYGTDLTYKLDDKTTVKAELATTDTDNAGIEKDGQAYLIEATHEGDQFRGKAYFRNQDEGFGLGHQMGSESGKQKYGIEGAYTTDSKKLTYSSHIYKQINLKTDAERDFGSIKATYQELKGKYSLYTGFQHVIDSFSDNSENTSSQILLGGQTRLLDKKLTLGIENMLSLPSSDESSDYPSRTSLIANYKINKKVSVFATQEFAWSEEQSSETTIAGLKATPWSNGTVTASIGEEFNENGHRIFSNYGLNQSVEITKRLTLSASLDRSNTISLEPAATPLDLNTPLASGGDDFTAGSIGLGYRMEKSSTNTRIEALKSRSLFKTTLISGINGEISSGLSMALGLRGFHSESRITEDWTNDINLNLSIARRPRGNKVLILSRTDFIYNDQWEENFHFTNWRIVENADINWRGGRKIQLALKLGAKYVNDTINDYDYSGITSLVGFEGRYDITKKIDIGLRAMMLNSWHLGQEKYLFGPSIGYNVMKNIWVSLGYNVTGFKDADFSRANYTYDGTYLKFRIKFDENTLRSAVKWISGQ